VGTTRRGYQINQRPFRLPGGKEGRWEAEKIGSWEKEVSQLLSFSPEPVKHPQKIVIIFEKVTIHVLSSLQIINNCVWFRKNRNHS
jgi:hypothetical protein